MVVTLLKSESFNTYMCGAVATPVVLSAEVGGMSVIM